jgi:hypothetical protein
MKAESKEQESITKKNPTAMPTIYLRERMYPKERPIEALLIVLGPGEKVVTNANINSEITSTCIL